MKPRRFPIMTMVVLIVSLGLVWSALAAERQTYTVQPGDSLSGISQKFYGDTRLWPKLWEMNRSHTSNPHRITAGDVLIIYTVDELLRGDSQPAPPPVAKNLYDRGRPLDIEFPKYFTFVADPKGIGGTGVQRVKVKKIDPLTGQTVVTYDEIRQVGEVIASTETGYRPADIDQWTEENSHGKLLLAYNDDVIIRFTADIAKILDSATHEDPDPYFREFPIYGLTQMVTEPDPTRHDGDAALGQIHEFKGKLTVVARVETLGPMTTAQESRLAGGSGLNRDSEPVSYVARITNSILPINLGDRIFLFKSIHPGPDREIGGPKARPADQYRAPAY